MMLKLIESILLAAMGMVGCIGFIICILITVYTVKCAMRESMSHTNDMATFDNSWRDSFVRIGLFVSSWSVFVIMLQLIDTGLHAFFI